MQPTERQIKFLKENGKEIPATKKEASEILNGLWGDSQKPASNRGSGYAKKTYPKKVVKRNIPNVPIDQEIINSYDSVIAHAYAIAKKELPEEDENDQNFGWAFTAAKHIVGGKFF